MDPIDRASATLLCTRTSAESHTVNIHCRAHPLATASLQLAIEAIAFVWWSPMLRPQQALAEAGAPCASSVKRQEQKHGSRKAPGDDTDMIASYNRSAQ